MFPLVIARFPKSFLLHVYTRGHLSRGSRSNILGMNAVWLGPARPLLAEFHLHVLVPRASFAVIMYPSMYTVVFTVFANDGVQTADATHNEYLVRFNRTLATSANVLSPLCATLHVVFAMPTISCRPSWSTPRKR